MQPDIYPCVFYFPDLLNIELQPGDATVIDDFPALTTWLARADIESRNTDVSPLRTAFELLGYPLATDEELPTAALRAATNPAAGTQWCLDPVSLRIDRDTAVMLPPELLQLDAAEAEQLIVAINQHFLADGLQLTMLTPATWQLTIAPPLRLHTTELMQAVDRDVRRVQPQGEDARRWRNWLNEIEMLLYNHPVNQQREQGGHWPVNSVWLWGGGELRTAMTPTVAAVYTDESLLHDLARHLKIQAEPLPMALQPALAAKPAHFAVIAFEALFAPTDNTARLNQLRLLEQNWFQPMLQAVKSGVLPEIKLHTGTQQFTLTRRSLRRWWRRRRPLREWLTPLQ